MEATHSGLAGKHAFLGQHPSKFFRPASLSDSCHFHLKLL